ncbi:MAG: Na/Pi cotransporter family protein [Lachnospiraceae bacterium]|nr:Na/Pi cotransporter family protein [Lachnospiraceae bacterium]
MDFFDVLNMVLGLALFLFGMNLMGDSLAAASGGRLEKILEKLTNNPLKAVAMGAAVTAVIQSSSATTVMVVGFVNSGIMKLNQAVGIIMGANVGTTITAWILSLTGIESGNFLVQMCKPASFCPILAIIGIGITMFSKDEKKRNVANILIGFAILMTGMDTMSDAVKPLRDVPEFTSILTRFSNPLLGLLAGMILTAIIQSSSASVGILQALCLSGAVGFSTALPIIMGQNIGTCVTAMISGIGASKNAKRTALIHLYFNIIGTTVFMIGFYIIHAIVDFPFMYEMAAPTDIATVHTIFNITATLILLPFAKQLVKLATITIPDEEVVIEKSHAEKILGILDPRFLEMPSYAIEQSRNAAESMADLTKESIEIAMELLMNYDEAKAQRVVDLEDEIDQFEDQIGSYLVKVSSKNLSTEDSHTASVILHCIGDFERISDHARNIKEAAQEMYEKQLEFSEKAKEELEVFKRAVHDILEMSIRSFKEEDLNLAKQVEPLEEVIDKLNLDIKQRHVKRLRKGKCTIELGFVLSDITTNFERISDHCSNVAVCLLEVSEDEFDTHAYVNELKKDDNIDFRSKVLVYEQQYRLP